MLKFLFRPRFSRFDACALVIASAVVNSGHVAAGLLIAVCGVILGGFGEMYADKRRGAGQ